MAFIGVFVFTGMYVETNSFETTIEDYYNETNLADGWIYSDYLVDDAIEQVYLLGATTQMERQLVVDAQAELSGKPDITLHFVENNTISKFYLLEGEELDINDSGGVWLDKKFADARNLEIGDEITFESNGIEITKEIKGLGYSPEYVYYITRSETVPDHSATGFAYMSHKAFPSDNITYNVLNVKFDGKPETFSKLLDYRLHGYYTSFLQRSNHYSVDVVAESISQQNSLTGVFPAIFIIISMLMLLTTMKRIISNQRTQIGILKAIGFKNNELVKHYISPGFIIVTIGSVFGAFLGPIVFHMIAHPSRTYYYIFPYWHSIGLMNTAIIIPFMSILALLVANYSIKNIINEPTSMIMKPKVPKISNSSFIEKLKIWNKFSFNYRWNIRNIKRNKFRAIMTIFGIIGCTVLLITGFGLYEKINESKDWNFNDVNHFESKLIISGDTSSSQINLIAEKVNGDPIMDSSIEIIKNKIQRASLLVLNGTDLITMTDDNHNKIDIGNDEVSISKKMADMMDIDVGDIINCRALDSDKIVKIKIDKIHSSPFSQGLVMSPDKLEEIGLNYTPTGIVTSQHINKVYDGIIDINYINDLIKGWDELEETSMVIILLLVFFAVILALIILYNSNLLSFTEMKNDITILKVLGFDSVYLTKILATQSLFFIILGFLLGIPISQSILSFVMPAFGEEIYLIPSISIVNLVITFFIIISVSMLLNLYFLHKIKNFDMVDSLKDLKR